jgi:glyoxylase-like metal-dependent hydrolase (beta-lactamase superfamily II)
MTSWGNYIESRTVVETPELAIHQVSRPARGCLSYVVVSGGKAIVIDPLRQLEPYFDLAKSRDFTIEGVIDTHAHADHISGGSILASRTGATYFLHPYDAIHPMDLLPAAIPYEPIREGQIFHVGSQRLETMHIPGHTLGLIALRLDDKYLFTGDSIFIQSLARPDLGGKAQTWARLHYQSLRRLLALPGKMTVLPGHFSSLGEYNAKGSCAAPLDELKKSNEGLLMLQRESEDGFLAYLVNNLPELIPEYVDIKRVNVGLMAPNEEDAAALELGKNACAISRARETHAGAKP